jgi:hypothetical protein
MIASISFIIPTVLELQRLTRRVSHSLVLFPLDRRRFSCPDDPTVQESIECVFASQLEEGLPLMLFVHDEEHHDEYEGDDDDDDDQDKNINWAGAPGSTGWRQSRGTGQPTRWL